MSSLSKFTDRHGITHPNLANYTNTQRASHACIG